MFKWAAALTEAGLGRPRATIDGRVRADAVPHARGDGASSGATMVTYRDAGHTSHNGQLLRATTAR